MCKTRRRRERSKLATTARLIVCSVFRTGAGGAARNPEAARLYTVYDANMPSSMIPLGLRFRLITLDYV